MSEQVNGTVAPAAQPQNQPQPVSHETNIPAAPEIDPALLQAELERTGESDPQEPSYEIEYKGQKIKVDPVVHEAYGALQKAATEKFEAAAAERKAIEDQKTAFSQAQQTLTGFIGEVTEIKTLTEQIAAYKNVDWDKAAEQDSANAQKHWIKYQALEKRRADLAGGIQGKIQATQQQQADAQRKAAEAAVPQIRQHIKDWSPERATEVKGFVQKNYGVDANTAALIDSAPWAARIAADAFAYRRLLAGAKQQGATQPGQVPAVMPQNQAQPIRRVAGGSTGAKTADAIAADPTKSAEDYRRAYFAEQQARQQARAQNGQFRAR